MTESDVPASGSGARFRSDKKVNCNARMGPRQVRQHCKLSDESQELIRVAMTELNLSARAYDRILKVSRTVADLQSNGSIFTPLTRDTGPTKYIIDEFGIGLVITIVIAAILVCRRARFDPPTIYR